VSQYFWGGNEKYDAAFIVSGEDVRNLDDVVRMQRVTRYMISQGKAVADVHAIRLALSMDVVRETTYRRNDAGRSKAQKLNVIVPEGARVTGVPFLDLRKPTPPRTQSGSSNLTIDWHWNRRANRLVGETLADLMVRDRTFTIVRRRRPGRLTCRLSRRGDALGLR
jgi:hypothetical protein